MADRETVIADCRAVNDEMEVTAGLIQKLVDENATRKLDQHDPQRCGSQHGDLKKAAAGRFRGLSDILSAVFVYGNLLISYSPYS